MNRKAAQPDTLADRLRQRVVKALATFELKRNGRRRPSRRAKTAARGGRDDETELSSGGVPVLHGRCPQGGGRAK